MCRYALQVHSVPEQPSLVIHVSDLEKFGVSHGGLLIMSGQWAGRRFRVWSKRHEVEVFKISEPF